MTREAHAEAMSKAFEITSIARADLVQAGYTEAEALGIDDGDMREIASKMADAYCDNGFWIDLPIIVSAVTGLDEK